MPLPRSLFPAIAALTGALAACELLETNPEAETSVPCTLAAGQVVTLADAPADPGFLALDADRVYWLTDGGVASVKKDGTGPTLIATTATPNMNPPQIDGSFGGIAVDATHVYFGAGSYVYRVPKTGGATELVAGNRVGGRVAQIALDADNVYWADWGNGVVAKAGKATPGGSVMTVLAKVGGKPRYLAVDDTSVYGTDAGVYRVGKDGTGLLTNLTGGGPTNTSFGAIVVDATSIYWLQWQTGVFKANKDGTNPVLLHEDRTTYFPFHGLAQDATTLYFAHQSTFGFVKKDGTGFGSLTVPSDGAARKIAVDANSVYWTHDGSTGTIRKACR